MVVKRKETGVAQKQIHMYVPEYLHKEIHIAVIHTNTTITSFIIGAVLEKLQVEKSKRKELV